MTDMPRVMLLIDADNVSADVIEQAVKKVLATHIHLHVRRAYCNAETALKQQALFKRLSVRPMVNLSAGKNSTDIALAVDAMDLVVAERPQIVYLVSSDSDFAPLVIRLREKGCRVCGIGQKGKTGEETTMVYDEFTDLQHHSAGSGASSPASASASTSTSRTASPKAAAKRAPAAKRASRASGRPADAEPAPTARVTSKAPPPPAPASSPSASRPARALTLSDDVIRILDAVPELLAGGKVELNQATERLRASRLLGRSASSIKFFDKFPDMFWLTPDDHPHKVQYIGPTSL